MFRDRLTPLAERLSHSLVMCPVIVETIPGKLQEVFAEIKGFIGEKIEIVPRVLTEITPLGPYPFYIMPRFSMFAALLNREIVWDLAEDTRVKRIYPDKINVAFAYPTVPEEGIFEYERRPKKVKKFTSTLWTKKALGIDEANAKGFTGKGVKVSIVDTGAGRTHEQIRRVKFETVIKLQHRDENGHGCVHPDALVFTSKCGIQRIEDFYNMAEGPEIRTPEGWTKHVKDAYTLGWVDGKVVPVRITAVHKMPQDDDMVEIETRTSKVLLTPWHKVYLFRRTWKGREDILRKRADELENYKVHKYMLSPKLDFRNLVFLRKGDPVLGYIVGSVIGDGLVRKKHKWEWVLNYITVAMTEEPEYAKAVQEFLEKNGYKVRNDGGSVVVYSPELRAKLKELGVPFGRDKAYYSELPEPISKQIESLRAFVAAIFDTEGSVDKGRARVRINMAAKKLLKQLYGVLSNIGIPCKYYDDGKPIGRFSGASLHIVGKEPLKDFYDFIAPYSLNKRKLRELEEGISTGKNDIPKREDVYLNYITSIRRRRYKGFFYDFTTESGNYFANGVLVSNTWCVSCVGGIRGRDEYLSARTRRTVECEGMAPECDLLAVKALGYYIGSGSTSGLIKAIEMSVDWGAKIISCSWGSANPQETSPDQDAFYPVFEELKAYNIIPVVANGNEGPGEGTVGSPGNMPNCVSVGAYDPITGEVAYFSSRGPTRWGAIKPDCIMPGVNIDSGCVGVIDWSVDGLPTRYAPISGTSMATPHASGVLAVMEQMYRDLLGRTLTLDEVMRFLEAMQDHPKNNDAGWGVITFNKIKTWLSTEYGVEL